MKKYPKLGILEIILIILLIYKFGLALTSSGLIGLFFKIFYILAIFWVGMHKKPGFVLAIICASVSVILDSLIILAYPSYLNLGTMSDFIIDAAMIIISIVIFRKISATAINVTKTSQ